jgi:hypothetical protein
MKWDSNPGPQCLTGWTHFMAQNARGHCDQPCVVSVYESLLRNLFVCFGEACVSHYHSEHDPSLLPTTDFDPTVRNKVQGPWVSYFHSPHRTRVRQAIVVSVSVHREQRCFVSLVCQHKILLHMSLNAPYKISHQKIDDVLWWVPTYSSFNVA